MVGVRSPLKFAEGRDCAIARGRVAARPYPGLRFIAVPAAFSPARGLLLRRWNSACSITDSGRVAPVARVAARAAKG
eukprot:11180104-Lingulodinium_polyedra.AAC.1